MEKKQTSETFCAEEARKLIEEHGLKMTAYKRQMLEACDGQPIRVISRGRREVTGRDGIVYYLDATLGRAGRR